MISSQILQVFTFRDKFFLIELRRSYDPDATQIFVRDESGSEEEVASLFDLMVLRTACEKLLCQPVLSDVEESA